MTPGFLQKSTIIFKKLKILKNRKLCLAERREKDTKLPPTKEKNVLEKIDIKRRNKYLA